MLKRYSVFLFAIAFSACSDSNDPTTPPTPDPAACESELATGLSFSSTYAYTEDIFKITGTKFCKEDLASILLNDTEVSILAVLPTELSFKIPQGITTDSVALKIKTKTQTVDLKKKVAVFPGNGNWTEVMSFPGEARSDAGVAVWNNKAYISGGVRSTGYINSEYTFKRYNDLYEYDPATNAWTFILNNDHLSSIDNTIAWNNTLFVMPQVISNAVITMDIESKAFSLTKAYAQRAGSDALPFKAGNDLYSLADESLVKAVTIRKYNAADKSWQSVQSTPYEANAVGYYTNAGFEYNGLIYLTWNERNSKEVGLWTYAYAENKLTKLSSVTLTTHNANRLDYLFTLNDLAYFTESGDASVNPTSGSLDILPQKLFIFNLKAGTWREVSHGYPVPFYRAPAFTIDGKGYCGFGVSSGSPTFNYSNKFFRFNPK